MRYGWSWLLVAAAAWPAASHAIEPGEAPLCPYAAAHDAPLEPTERLVSETDQYTQLRVEFNGIRAERVPAYLYLPRAAARPGPAVLLQYGSGGNKNTSYIVAIGRQFVAHGFVVLTIDAPGRGERKGETKHRTDWLFSDEGRDVFLEYCGDYSRAVDYLLTRPEVDRRRVGYVGISWGAITGVTFVAHDPRIRAMGSMVGGGGFLGLAGLLADRPDGQKLPIDPVCYVGRIAPRPLLLVNVTRDQLVPRPFAEALHRAAGPDAKVVWLEADHFFNGVDRTEVAESVIRFMEESLPPEEASGQPSNRAAQ